MGPGLRRDDGILLCRENEWAVGAPVEMCEYDSSLVGRETTHLAYGIDVHSWPYFRQECQPWNCCASPLWRGLLSLPFLRRRLRPKRAGEWLWRCRSTAQSARRPRA